MPVPSWMQNAPPNTKDRRLMHVADRMYDFCRELESGINSVNQDIAMIAKRAKYLADKYDDEMSTDDPVEAPKQLGESMVKTVANMITEDPDVLSESLHTAEDVYSYEEVPVDPSRNILAHVQYTYGIDVSGEHVRATMYNPAESPVVDIELLDAKIINAVDDTGEDIQPSSEAEAAMWRDNAIKFFETRLYDSVKDQAYSNMQNGDYSSDDSDIQYERMRDYQDARLMSNPNAWRQ